ncbi:BTB/POZ domain-containing protein KCTD9-like isoform X2 [Amblyomma americanum]
MRCKKRRHPEPARAESNSVRVTVFKNGENRDGKVFLVPGYFGAFLVAIGEKFGMAANRLFTQDGTEIFSLDSIKDDDVLVVSSGENFNAPPSKPLSLCPGDKDAILINVGGQHFETTKTALFRQQPRSLLGCLFSQNADEGLCLKERDASGAYLVDRCPTYFAPLLDCLHDGELRVDEGISPRGVLEEAKFFGLDWLIPELEEMCKQEERGLRGRVSLTRQDVVRILIKTPVSEIRFQGEDLRGADLSRLNLRRVDFKRADLRHSCLEFADLSQADLEGAQLLGAKMAHANLEGADLNSCNMGDPDGKAENSADLRGANLTDAKLDDSVMYGVNLRSAQLKNASLRRCDLRCAALASTDITICDLRGARLGGVDLRP